MRWLSVVQTAAAFLAGADVVAALPSASPRGLHVHERREASHQRLHRRLDGDVVLPMRIGLRQNENAAAQSELWLREVSDPTSEHFGKHWSVDKVIEAFKPTDETVDAVHKWLVENGIAKERITHSDNKAWLAFDATANEAEALLQTEYYHDADTHHDAKRATVGSNAYHLPGHIRPHIDYITPGVKSVAMNLHKRRLRRSTEERSEDSTTDASATTKSRNARRSRKPFPSDMTGKDASSLETCDQVLSPACVQALYDFAAPDPQELVSPENVLGIFEEGDYYDQLDLDAFYHKYVSSQVPNGTHPKLESIDGGVAPVDNIADDGGESLLDFGVAYPIIYPQQITLYQTDDEYYAADGGGGTGLFNTFLDALDGSYCTYAAYGETGNSEIDPTYPDKDGPASDDPYLGQLMCGVYKPTNIISISYGVYEQDQPYAYQKRQCDEYLKLALQGVTILFASGDTGVGGYTNGTFGDLGFYGCLGDNDSVFTPSQACSCPWVTNVGATEIFPNKTVSDPEQAVLEMADRPNGNYSSSGGFSNIFGIPWYQLAAVEQYYLVDDPPYPYYYDGHWQNATNGGVYNRNGRGIPDVAANGDNYPVAQDGDFYLSGGTSQSAPLFASLLNRIVDERIKIGKGALGFVNPTLYAHPDVLNDITEGKNPGCGTWGFSCAPGWDPVTGLGTPNYPKLLELFLSLP